MTACLTINFLYICTKFVTIWTIANSYHSVVLSKFTYRNTNRPINLSIGKTHCNSKTCHRLCCSVLTPDLCLSTTEEPETSEDPGFFWRRFKLQETTDLYRGHSTYCLIWTCHPWTTSFSTTTDANISTYEARVPSNTPTSTDTRSMNYCFCN